jgi:hypothetical protein
MSKELKSFNQETISSTALSEYLTKVWKKAISYPLSGNSGNKDFQSGFASPDWKSSIRIRAAKNLQNL